MIPAFLYPESMRRAMGRQLKEENRLVLERALQDWHHQIKWDRQLAITATSMQQCINEFDLFAAAEERPGGKVSSPKGEWEYRWKVLPGSRRLSTAYGSQSGFVVFDAPVTIPGIFRTNRRTWDNNPWMSLTPQEMITQRGGVRASKGHTVVAGLGMGFALRRIAARKKVTKVTLVEQDQDLMDWLWPQIEPHTEGKVEVIIGDAYKVLPKLEADVAVVDIYPSYGGNDYNFRLREGCPGIGKVWIWGTQYTC